MFNNYNIYANQNFSLNCSLSAKDAQTRNTPLLYFQNQPNHAIQTPCEPQNYSQSINNLYNPTQFNHFPNQHSKSYSLPVNFNEPLSSGLPVPQLTNQLQPPSHVRLSFGELPLPYGWSVEKSQSGQPCFVKYD
jgi:hypothetical protein